MLMKKILILFVTLLLYITGVSAQSKGTNYYSEPERYVLYSLTDYNNVMFVLDSQKGIIKLIYVDVANIYVNDTDLTNGTPTKDGRFRLLIEKDSFTSNALYKMIDTEDGRVWTFKLNPKQEKCKFRLVNEGMPK